MDFWGTNVHDQATKTDTLIDWQPPITAAIWPSSATIAEAARRPKKERVSTEVTSFEQEPPSEPSTVESLPNSIKHNWSRLFLSRLTDPFFARVMRMARRPPGWRGAGSKALDPASLRDFLEFWMIIRQESVEPEVALVPNGHLQVGWHRNGKHHLDIEFIGNGKAYYGLFDGGAIHEGIEMVDRLAVTLLSRDSSPLQW